MAEHQHKPQGLGWAAVTERLHSAALGASRCCFQAHIFSYNIIDEFERSKEGVTN